MIINFEFSGENLSPHSGWVTLKLKFLASRQESGLYMAGIKDKGYMVRIQA